MEASENNKQSPCYLRVGKFLIQTNVVQNMTAYKQLNEERYQA